MGLECIAGVSKRVQYTLNVMNPKVRLEVKLFVDRHFRATHSELVAWLAGCLGGGAGVCVCVLVSGGGCWGCESVGVGWVGGLSTAYSEAVNCSTRRY